MTINRRKVYPIVIVANLISATVRMLVFPELGIILHVLTFISAFFVGPLMLEGAVWIHNQYNRILPYAVGIHGSSQSMRMVQRMGVQILTGVLTFALFGALMLWLYGAYIPQMLRTPMLTKPFMVAATLTGILFVVTINLALFGREFFDNWKSELIRNERLSKERAEVQFDNLKNQFNPHFLFNSLTSLNSLIFDNPHLASEFLQQLSKVYRYVLQANNDLVSLETELTFIKRYVHLLETRFQEGLKVDVEISEEALEKKIAPVTLQILIENAIKHNIASVQKPLHIRIFDGNGFLSVANNVQRKTIMEESNKQGLQRVVQLYSYLDKRAVVIAEVNEVFCVKIPLL